MDVTDRKTKSQCTAGGARSRGSLLLELMIALTVLTLAVLGHCIMGYNAKLDIVRSARQSTAATTALLLCESWAGAEGATTYDPVADLAAQLTLTNDTGPSAPDGFTNRGSYSAVVDGVTYYATLSSQELASALRAVNVTVAWSSRDGSGAMDKSFGLTTYVLLD